MALLIEEIQAYIKKQIGLDLEPCDYFTGLKRHKGETYYNFQIIERYSESHEVLMLERLASNSGIVYRVEPNGTNRVAIYFR